MRFQSFLKFLFISLNFYCVKASNNQDEFHQKALIAEVVSSKEMLEKTHASLDRLTGTLHAFIENSQRNHARQIQELENLSRRISISDVQKADDQMKAVKVIQQPKMYRADETPEY